MAKLEIKYSDKATKGKVTIFVISLIFMSRLNIKNIAVSNARK